MSHSTSRSTLNTPWQDAQGGWVCPRCGRADFSHRMGVLGHMRTCKVEAMWEQPVALGNANQAPRFASYRPAQQQEAPPAWFASEMMRLHSRFDAAEGRVQALEKFTGNHNHHLRLQLAGAAGVGPVAAREWIPGVPNVLTFIGGLGVTALILGWFSRSDESVRQVKRLGDVAGSATKVVSGVKTFRAFLT